MLENILQFRGAISYTRLEAGAYKCSDSCKSGGTEERQLPQWREGFQEEAMLLKVLGEGVGLASELWPGKGGAAIMTVPPKLNPGEGDPKGNRGRQEEEWTLDRQKQ